MAARDELRKAEEEAANRRREATAQAHRDFIDRRANFIESNPGATSRQEAAGIFAARDRMGLSERENELHRQRLEIQDKINEPQTARFGRFGDDGKYVGGSDVAVSENTAASDALKLTQAREIASIRAEQQAEAARARFGYTDENGEYHPGSDVSAAKVRSDAQRLISGEKNATAERIAGMRSETQRTVAEGNNRATVAAAQTRAETAEQRQKHADEQRMQSQFLAWTRDLSDPLKNGGLTSDQRKEIQAMTPEERRKWWEKNVYGK